MTVLNGGAAADTYIYQVSNGNYGSSLSLYVRGTGGAACKTMLSIDVSSIPANSVIDSATLTLQMIGGSSASPTNVTEHLGLRQWWEGIQNSGVPPPGEDGSTWPYRNHKGSVTWGTAGGQADVDYASAVLATTSVANLGPYNWDIKSAVQAWVNGTTNYGIWLLCAADIWKQFSSREGLTPSYRPAFSVDYTLAGGGGIFVSGVFYSGIVTGTIVR